MKPKNVKTIRFIFCCLFFATVFHIASDFIRAERLPVKIYTSADGLGSSFIDSMFRDSRGFMWFCTRDGLSRFDGSRFVTYQIGEKDAPPGIEVIYETRDGNYWISTTGGVYRFNPNDISPANPATPRLNVEYVTGWRGTFFEDSKGNVWLASGSIFRLEDRDGKKTFEKVDWGIPPKPNVTFVAYEIHETNDGSLWAFTSWGIVRRLPDTRIVVYAYDNVIYAGGGGISMLADKSGRVWVTILNQVFVIKPEPVESLTETGQVIVKSLKPTSVFELKPEENMPLPKKGGEIFQFTNRDFIERSAVKRFFQTSDGDIWITAEDRLLQISNNILHLHSDTEGLPSAMTRMTEDAAGNLWICGYAGLARLDRNGMVTFGKNDGASSTRFFAINEGADRTLYFANLDSHITRFDGAKLKSVRPAIAPNSTHLWTSRFTFLASNGDWWILTNGKLYRFSGVTNFAELEGKAPSKTYTIADGLKSEGMFQIFEDSSGDIWVSTRGASSAFHGLARLKKGEEKFYTFTEAEGYPPKVSPSSFAEDRNGNIWFGFYDGGLARFDGEKFIVFTQAEGLPEGIVLDLHLDSKGRLWGASSNSGLFRIDDTSAKIPAYVRIFTDQGLSSNNIRTITEDRFGRIYAGTASGVDRLSPDTGQFKHYSVNDGLAADFVVDSHCDKTGNLWFATHNGVSRLVPLPDEKSSAPRIFLGGLRIAGVEQAVSDLGNTEIEKGELAHTENNLQIEFFGLDFRAGETLRYQYKLEGADADWSAPNELRTVTYGNLQPATYRFLVRAVNSDGISSENPAVVSFKILPPIWARWWFITLCILAVALIVTAFYRYRLARLREINAALEEAKFAEESFRKSREERLAELEKVRSRIATDLHDDIGASLTQIAILSEVAQAQSRSNGASEPLTKITDVSNELVNTMSDIVWSINPAKDHLSDLIQRMRRFASDSLSAKGIVFHFNSPPMDDDISIGTNMRREVFLVFKESINNIVKHSSAKSVDVEFQISGDFLTLKIVDDGKGFKSEPPAVAGGLDVDNRASSLNENPPATAGGSDNYGGNGLLSMKKRAAEMNGECSIISENNKGTEIILKLPLDIKNNLERPAQTGGDISVRKA